MHNACKPDLADNTTHRTTPVPGNDADRARRIAHARISVRLAVDTDLAFVHGFQMDHAEQRASAGATGSEDGHHLAALHAEVDAAQHLAPAIRFLRVAADDKGLALLRLRLGLGAEILDPIMSGEWRGARASDGAQDGCWRRRVRRWRPAQPHAEHPIHDRVAAHFLALPVDAALEPRLQQRDGASDAEINDAGGREHGEELEVLRHDLLRAEDQLVDEDDRRDRRQLDHADRIVGEVRQDRPHGLRQHDAPERRQPPHAEGGGRNRLIARHGENADADELGREAASLSAQSRLRQRRRCRA